MVLAQEPGDCCAGKSPSFVELEATENDTPRLVRHIMEEVRGESTSRIGKRQALRNWDSREVGSIDEAIKSSEIGRAIGSPAHRDAPGTPGLEGRGEASTMSHIWLYITVKKHIWVEERRRWLSSAFKATQSRKCLVKNSFLEYWLAICAAYQ